MVDRSCLAATFDLQPPNYKYSSKPLQVRVANNFSFLPITSEHIAVVSMRACPSHRFTTLSGTPD